MIIFLFGLDTYRGKQKVVELKNKFIKELDPHEHSLSVINGLDTNINIINQKLGTASLLSKKRMVVIEDLFLNKNKILLEELLDFFKKRKQAVEDNIIIIWETSLKIKKIGNIETVVLLDASGKEKALLKSQKQFFDYLKKQPYTQDFKELSNTEAGVWARDEVNNRGGQITHQAINLLISLVGNDLWKVSHEIDKLINYRSGLEPKLTAGGKPFEIQAEDVMKLTRGNFDENIFALTDAIGARNKSLSLRLLEEQYEAGLTDPYLINMIMRQFKILLQIRQALDQGQTSRKIITSLKLHPFIVQKGINQVRNFDLEVLKAIINRIIEIDYLMKKGRADAKTMLNLLLAKI